MRRVRGDGMLADNWLPAYWKARRVPRTERRACADTCVACGQAPGEEAWNAALGTRGLACDVLLRSWQRPPDSGSSRECNILLQGACGHAVCAGCLVARAREALASGRLPRCAACGTRYPRCDFRGLLHADVYRALRHAGQEATPCPHQGCDGLAWRPRAAPFDAAPMARCDGCGRMSSPFSPFFLCTRGAPLRPCDLSEADIYMRCEAALAFARSGACEVCDCPSHFCDGDHPPDEAIPALLRGYWRLHYKLTALTPNQRQAYLARAVAARPSDEALRALAAQFPGLEHIHAAQSTALHHIRSVEHSAALDSAVDLLVQ